MVLEHIYLAIGCLPYWSWKNAKIRRFQVGKMQKKANFRLEKCNFPVYNTNQRDKYAFPEYNKRHSKMVSE